MADEVTVAADATSSATDQIPEDEETVALYRHARSPVPAVVLIDRINKQSNIGGIVRSASAFGVNHLCFIGPVRVASRPSHVNQHSNKPARVPYHHMTAAALNNCFHDKAIRSTHDRPLRRTTLSDQHNTRPLLSQSTTTHSHSLSFAHCVCILPLSASLAFLT